MNQEIADRKPVTPSRKRATVLLALGGYANTIITILQGLLMVPLYLHFLGAHTYGLWLASGGMLGMLWLMNFGVGSLVTQRVANAYGEKDHVKARNYFFNGLFVYSFISLLYGIAGSLVSIWLPDILKATGENAKLLQQCFVVAVVANSFAIFNECLRSAGQAMLRPVVPMMGMAVGRIVGIMFTVWILFDGLGLWAIPIGMLTAEVLILVINSIFVLKLFPLETLRPKLSNKILKEYLTTSPALLAAKSSNALSQQSEPLLITMLLSAEITTAYMIARKAADMLFLVVSVLNGSVLSSFSHLTGEGDRDKMNSILHKLAFIVFVCSLIGFSTYVVANNAFVSLWVGKEFLLSAEITLLIGVGFFSRAIRGLFWQLLYSIGDFTYTSLVVLIEGLGKILMSLILLGTVGVVGIPFAIVISSYLSLLMLGLRLRKTLSVEISGGSIFRLLLCLITSGLIIQFTFEGDTWFMFVLQTTALLLILSITVAVINWQLSLNYLTSIKQWPFYKN